MTTDSYENPLISRYASPEMSQVWGPRRRVALWRDLWIALATAQHELGLDVRPAQIAQMRAQRDNIDMEAARRYESQLRHDVMAHVHAFGDACPEARGVIHWGATSCFVTDNADLMILRDALRLVERRVATTILALADFAERHRDQACLGFTHFQPAQPTTVGKRACLWAYDLVLDLQELQSRLQRLKARGAKGATGTQASFLQLFRGDHDRVKRLEQRVAEQVGFSDCYAVTGQTYPRKVDSQILEALSGVAQSCHKFACDVRLLSSRRELEEPFEEKQIGSSAMAYKRNPMRSERICALARFAMSLPANAAQTAATQWMERTLDDSANRRLALPQAFLAVDSVLVLAANVAKGMRVHSAVVQRRLNEELPFMATESLLMAAVEQGGDRQALHEVIRVHSIAAAEQLKRGGDNDLIDRLAEDKAFAKVDVRGILQSQDFTGRSAVQVDEFLEDVVGPIRREFGEAPEGDAAVRV